MRTKKDIVKQISEEFSLTKVDTKKVVQRTFDAIIDTLVQDGRIELRNFGIFRVKRRKPRRARNPRTGAAVQLGYRNVVTFKPGKMMEERVKNAVIPALENKAQRGKSQPETAS